MQSPARMLMYLAAPMLLTGCVAINSDRPPPPPQQPRVIVTRRPVCPPLVTYAPEDQEKVAAAIEAMPEDAPTARMILDYGRLRAALRAACRGKVNA